MKRSIFALSVTLALTFTLMGCSKHESATDASAKPAAASKPADPIQAVASQGKGFTVGAMMSAQTVYVMFDPMPHAAIYIGLKPLCTKAKFVWVPVAIINGRSARKYWPCCRRTLWN
jgi:thiol:disulfide interchange protein DsbG